MPLSIREMHVLSAPQIQAALLHQLDVFMATPTPSPRSYLSAGHWSCQVVKDNNVMGLKESKAPGKQTHFVLPALGTGQHWENSTSASSVREDIGSAC